MEPINQTVASLMQRLKEKQRGLDEQGIEATCAKIFSRKELAHCQVQSFAKGALRVRVDSSSWLYYFMQHRQRFLERLQAQLQEARDIRFFVGDFKKEAAPRPPTKRKCIATKRISGKIISL